MEISTHKLKLFDMLLKGVAVASLVSYLISVMFPEAISQKVLLPFVLLLGVSGIVALLNTHYKFNFTTKSTYFYKIGLVLLVLSFFQLTQMLTVQQASQSFITGSNGFSQKSEFFALFNSIQLGLDVAFDIFYATGIMLMSMSFILTNSKMFIGWYGVAISLLLLVFNLISFPIPPRDKGLIDTGPFTIIWWGLFVWTIKSQSRYGKNIR